MFTLIMTVVVAIALTALYVLISLVSKVSESMRDHSSVTSREAVELEAVELKATNVTDDIK